MLEEIRMKYLSVPLLVLLVGPFVLAQDRANSPSRPDIVEHQDADVRAAIGPMLESTDAKDRAWAAYLVGDRRLDEEAPRLISLLGSEDEDYRVRAAALDSLIQLDADVPSDVLASVYEEFPNQAIILLSNAPEANK